jgi:hypothetical protein
LARSETPARGRRCVGRQYSGIKADTIARNFKITDDEREKLPILRALQRKLTPEEKAEAAESKKRARALAKRRAADRVYQAAKRKDAGATPRSESLSATRPWEAMRMSKRTYERWQKRQSETQNDANSSAKQTPWAAAGEARSTYFRKRKKLKDINMMTGKTRNDANSSARHTTTLTSQPCLTALHAVSASQPNRQDCARPGERRQKAPNEPVAHASISGSTLVGLEGLPADPLGNVIRFPLEPITLPTSRGLAVLSGITRADGNKTHFIRLPTNEAEDAGFAGMTRKQRETRFAAP